jgi:hypothetical protein
MQLMDLDFQQQIKNKTNDELLVIYHHADEYQEGFIHAVSAELISRNVDLAQVQPAKEKKATLSQQEFEKGRQGNEVYVVLSFVFAALGGVIGIIAGYTYSQSKHGNNAGNRYYVYNPQTRKLGVIMMIVGFFAMVLLLLWKFQ